MENTINQVDESIAGHPVDFSITPIPSLTPKMIGEQVLSNLEKFIEDERLHDDNLRLINFKRHLLNYLFKRIATREIDNNNKLKDIEPLEEDDNLILFSFFLSQNSNFHFEWSYLLNKIARLDEFLVTYRKHINYVCEDISELVKRIKFNENVQFIIDKYLSITYFPKVNAFDSKINLDLMSQLLLCLGNSYKVDIIYKFQSLISLSRYSNIEVEKITNKIETAMSYMVTEDSDKNMAIDEPNEK